MNAEVARALGSTKLRTRLDEEGFERATMTPAELTAFIQSQIGRWGPFIKRIAVDAGR